MDYVKTFLKGIMVSIGLLLIAIFTRVLIPFDWLLFGALILLFYGVGVLWETR